MFWLALQSPIFSEDISERNYNFKYSTSFNNGSSCYLCYNLYCLTCSHSSNCQYHSIESIYSNVSIHSQCFHDLMLISILFTFSLCYIDFFLQNLLFFFSFIYISIPCYFSLKPIHSFDFIQSYFLLNLILAFNAVFDFKYYWYSISFEIYTYIKFFLCFTNQNLHFMK